MHGLAAEIAELLHLPPTTTWRDLGGSWTTNLLATDPGVMEPTVFRVHRPSTSTERLLAEQAARRTLVADGVPAVAPLHLFEQGCTGRLHSGQLVEAEPFVPAQGRMRTTSRLITGFRTLGALHRSLARADLPPAARAVSFANHLPAERAVEATQRGADRIRSWGDPVLNRYADQVCEHVAEVDRLERALCRQPRHQVVHGDFWDNNVLFDGQRLAAVLDFGFMAERDRVDDLALPVWFALLEPGQELALDVLAGMLDAYDRTAEPLSREERLAVPLAIARQPAWSVGHWVVVLDDDDAVAHAQAVASDLPIAQAVLLEVARWQAALAWQP